jgi:hypothetical protein
MYESGVGPKHPNGVDVLNNLAEISEDRGHCAKVERLY